MEARFVANTSCNPRGSAIFYDPNRHWSDEDAFARAPAPDPGPTLNVE